MTKEEIAMQENSGLFSDYELGHTGLANAMDKYAEQTAIGFSDWQRELVFTENSNWLKEKTTKELYELYAKTLV